jgi:hypothetical protein
MTTEEQLATFEAGVVLLQHQKARIAELEAALEAKHQQYTGAVIQLTEARKALDAVNALISCTDVKMSGQVRYRFITTGQHEAAVLVQAARGTR